MEGDPSTTNIHISFPECSPGKVYTKFLEWHSSHRISKIECLNNGLISENVFSVEEEKYNTLKICYRPFLSNICNYSYFLITTSLETNKTLCLYGNTLPVEVKSDIKSITFDCVNKSPRAKTISLVNSSAVDTFYQFTNICENSGITISPSKGEIKQNEVIKITVTYNPKLPGFGYKKIFCLVKWQEPIVFEICTKYNKTSASNIFRDFIYTNEELPNYSDGYEEYIHDMVCLPKIPQILSLNKKYLDLGFRDKFKKTSVAFDTFKVTNNALIDCTLTWDVGKGTDFIIEPMKCTIESNSCQLFSVLFEPSIGDSMYAAEINASLNWGTDDEFVIPFPLSVHFIGHTLINKRTGWDPFYEVESKRIILPATIPQYSTATTFVIKNLMEKPLMFKFKPPYKSNFIVKPLQGIIDKGSQIVVIKFFPEVGCNKVYSEEWILEINGYITEKLQLIATSEYPFVQISDGSNIQFPPTSINCQESLEVFVVNRTRLHIKFKISTEDADCAFACEKEENLIGPLEQYDIKMFFRPQTYGKIVSTMICKMFLAYSGIEDITNESIILLQGVSSKIHISAQPNHFLLKALIKNWISTTFILYNESDCCAHISLKCFSRFGREVCEFPYKITPELFSLEPNSFRQIEIALCPNLDNIQKLNIICFLFTSKEFKDSITGLEAQNLLELEVDADKPKLEIKDLRFNGRVPNMTKLHFWKMLKINRLNITLKDIIDTNCKKIYMKLPAFEENSPSVFIELLIANKSNHGAELKIVNEKMCSCKCEQVEEGFSKRKLTSSCLHDSQIKFIMKKSKYLPSEQGVVEIHSEYTATDVHLYKFILIMKSTEDPSLVGFVELFFERHCPKEKTGFIDFFHLSLNNNVTIKLDPVFVGDPCKPIQFFWVYNNCLRNVDYILLPEQENKSTIGTIFVFLNKSGCIAPNTMHPLMIKFRPFQFMVYSISAVLKTQLRTINLCIKAQGQIQPCYSTFSMQRNLPLTSQFPSHSGFQLSVDHIILKPMLLHSVSKRLVRLKNNTEDRVKFYWVTRQFGALLNIRMIPSVGHLDPLEATLCQLIIHAHCTPARFNAHITCKLMNLGRRKLYLKSKRKFQKAVQLFDSGFEIVNEKYKPAVINVEVVPKPEYEFINLTVSIHTLSERFLNIVMPNVEDQIKALNQCKVVPMKNNPSLKLTKYEGDKVIDVLTRVTWEVLHKNIFIRSLTLSTKEYYYREILINEEQVPHKFPANITVLNVLNEVIINLLSKMIDATPQWDTHTFNSKIKGERKVERSPFRRLSNVYYSDILHQGPYGMISTYADKDIIIEKRRSDLSRRRSRFTFYETDLEDEDEEEERFATTYLSDTSIL